MSALRTVVYTRRRRSDGTVRSGRDVDGGYGSVAPAADATLDRPRSQLAAAAALLVPLIAFGWLGYTEFPELRIAIPIVLALALVTLRLTRHLNRRRSFDLAGVLLAGFAAKFLFVALRYNSIYGTYDGVGDAERYHENGVRLAQSYRVLDFSEPADGKVPGTGFIRIVTGYVYAVLPDRIAVGFIVFGVFALVGTYLLYRAFELAVPGGDARRFALLLFLWPSMLFWPGSIGKEAWMLLGIGLFTYGGARILAHRRGGFLLGAAGAWAIVMTRPHVMLLLFGAFVVGYALRPGSRFSNLGTATKAIGLAFLLGAGTFILAASNEYFEIEDLNRDSIEQELDETNDQTGQGGSRFSPPDPLGSPIGYPLALVTVLFRPFPFEADNAQMLLTSAEGLVLAGLLAAALPRVLRAPVLLRRWPFVAASLAYVAVFAFAFSSIANFGILARQRVQMLPFLFVLVALPRFGSGGLTRSDGHAVSQARPRR